MHWGTVIGSRADAEEFARLAPKEVEVQIPDKDADKDGDADG
jgi:hypothetical protein